MTRILVAPDKFRGTLTAAEAGEAMARGVAIALPDAEVDVLPFADGGEGTVDAVVAAGAERRTDRVPGPLGAPVDAGWALLGSTAVIEMSAASGLPLIERPDHDSALDSDTRGTGELIARALDAGARRIVLGVGGSAGTDGGTGALRALGVRIVDVDGVETATGGRGLASVAAVDLSGLDRRLAAVDVVLCSDVANPLCGPRGAARVFAPQKGASPATVEQLEAGMRVYGAVLAAATGVDVLDAEVGGAGGGIAAGLRAALGASLRPGVEVVADVLGLPARLDGVDLVIVGEGSLDEQSLLGKTPVGVARIARDRGIPVVAVSGRCRVGIEALAAEGIEAVATAEEEAGPGEDPLSDAALLVERATARLVRARRP